MYAREHSVYGWHCDADADSSCLGCTEWKDLDPSPWKRCIRSHGAELSGDLSDERSMVLCGYVSWIERLGTVVLGEGTVESNTPAEAVSVGSRLSLTSG